MKNKNILVVVSLILVFITIYIIRDTYGLFESKNIMNTNTNIAKWNVLINGTDIKSGENFVVNSVNIVGSDSVKNGKMAPGTEGYFDILIDPTDTDTSILYSVTFDFTKVNGSFVNKPGLNPFYDAPTLIIVFADKFVSTYIEDGSAVISNIINAAFSLDVDSCWVHRAKETFLTEFGKELMKKWGLGDNYVGVGNVVLGYRDMILPPASPRKEDYIIFD